MTGKSVYVGIIAKSTRVETKIKSVELRCSKCGKLLAEMITPPYVVKCPRCKEENRYLQKTT